MVAVDPAGVMTGSVKVNASPSGSELPVASKSTSPLSTLQSGPASQVGGVLTISLTTTTASSDEQLNEGSQTVRTVRSHRQRLVKIVVRRCSHRGYQGSWPIFWRLRQTSGKGQGSPSGSKTGSHPTGTLLRVPPMVVACIGHWGRVGGRIFNLNGHDIGVTCKTGVTDLEFHWPVSGHIEMVGNAVSD